MREITWDDLKRLLDWAQTLNLLLGDARKAIQDDDNNLKSETQELLAMFIERAPGRARELDEIAEKAAYDIFLDTYDKRMAEISRRSIELAKAKNLIEGATEDVEQSRKQVLFESIVSDHDKATSAIGKLKELAEEFSDNEKSVLERLEAIAEKIEELRNPA